MDCDVEICQETLCSAENGIAQVYDRSYFVYNAVLPQI